MTKTLDTDSASQRMQTSIIVILHSRVGASHGAQRARAGVDRVALEHGRVDPFLVEQEAIDERLRSSGGKAGSAQSVPVFSRSNTSGGGPSSPGSSAAPGAPPTPRSTTSGVKGSSLPVSVTAPGPSLIPPGPDAGSPSALGAPPPEGVAGAAVPNG